MISESARYHGSFFALLFEYFDKSIPVKKIDSIRGLYLLGESLPILLKYRRKRKSPWQFNFMRSHQEDLEKLYQSYGECLIALMCGSDGIAGLNMVEMRQVLDEYFEEQEGISISRSLRGMYHIKGRDGILKHRIGQDAIFRKIKSNLDLS